MGWGPSIKTCLLTSCCLIRADCRSKASVTGRAVGCLRSIKERHSDQAGCRSWICDQVGRDRGATQGIRIALASGLHQQPGPRRALPEEAAQTRKGIVTAASEEFRKNGIVATGLNDLMSAAGLTHGGFYKHFASKDQLVAEACAEAGTDLAPDR